MKRSTPLESDLLRRVRQLEALIRRPGSVTTTTTTGAVASSSRVLVEVTLDALSKPEDSFPIDVDLDADVVGVSVVRCRNLSVPTRRFLQGVDIDWEPRPHVNLAAAGFTIRYLTGLDNGCRYTVTLEVLCA